MSSLLKIMEVLLQHFDCCLLNHCNVKREQRILSAGREIAFYFLLNIGVARSMAINTYIWSLHFIYHLL